MTGQEKAAGRNLRKLANGLLEETVPNAVLVQLHGKDAPVKAPTMVAVARLACGFDKGVVVGAWRPEPEEQGIALTLHIVGDEAASARPFFAACSDFLFEGNRVLWGRCPQPDTHEIAAPHPFAQTAARTLLRAYDGEALPLEGPFLHAARRELGDPSQHAPGRAVFAAALEMLDPMSLGNA